MNERGSTARAALWLIPALALVACTGSASNTPKGGDGGTNKLDGGSADTGGTASGATIKFCNALALEGNMNLRLIMKVGEPPVELVADSGNCSTPVGSACKPIPVGMHQVMVTDDKGEGFAMGSMTVMAGQQVIMVATLDDMSKPTVEGGALKAGFTCAMFDPFEAVPPGDGGSTPTPGGDAGAQD